MILQIVALVHWPLWSLSEGGSRSVAKGVAITGMGQLLRRPWYGWWRLVQRTYSGREYVLAIPQGQRIFSPWFAGAGGAFPDLLTSVREHGRLTVSPDRCYVLYHYAAEAGRRWPVAPMAECGVYTGGTAEVISQAATTATLHLFDSFEGMPAETHPARDYHAPGDFSDTSLGAVQERLKNRDCQFHVGFMPDTFAEVAGVKDYSFVHVDVDIYTSVRDCVEYFWPRMAPGGVMIFDDYGFYPYRLAARRAVDEFFDRVPEIVLALPTGQGLVVKDT